MARIVLGMAADQYERVLGRKGIAEILILVGYYTSVLLAMKIHLVRTHGR